MQYFERKAAEILDVAIDIHSVEELERYLHGVCGDDHVLRAHVERLLQAHENASDFLEGAFECEPADSVTLQGESPDAACVTDAPPPPTEEDMLGDYRLIREIARGGMGVVYEAEQISLNRRVALKILPFAAVLDQRQLKRFATEAKAAASLQHPHIVNVYGVGQARGVHYYAMQYIEGHDAAELIRQLREISSANLPATEWADFELDSSLAGGKFESAEVTRRMTLADQYAPSAAEEGGALPEKGSRPNRAAEETRAFAVFDTQVGGNRREFFQTVAKLGIQAAEALEYAHRRGVLHRDIKPSNLMIDAGGRLLITDFGLARVEGDAALTMTGDVMGTLRYMSPEQALGDNVAVDCRSDVYSLGVTLYEMLTLRPVYPNLKQQELLRKRAEEDPVPPRRINKAIPAELETIILKAISREPADRYATAQHLADDLRRFLNHEPIHATRPTVVKRLVKWTARHREIVITMFLTMSLSSFVLSLIAILMPYDKAADSSESPPAMVESYIESGSRPGDERLLTAGEIEAHRRGYPSSIQIAQNDLALALKGYQLSQIPRRVEARNVLRPYTVHPELRHLRGFEWFLLDRQVNHAPRYLPDADGDVAYSINFSPDDALLAVSKGGSRGTVYVWDTKSWRLVTLIDDQKNDANSAVFSPSGDWLATSSDDFTVALWSVSDWSKWHSLKHDTFVPCVRFIPDSPMLVTGDNDGVLRIWDGETGALIARRDGHVSRICSMEVASDSKLLATASRDRTAKLWALPDLTEVLTIDHPAEVDALALDNTTSTLFTGSNDGVVRAWDLRSGALLREYQHGHRMRKLALSSDAKKLAITAHHNTLTVLGTDFLRVETYCFGRDQGGGWSAAFSHDGTILAAGHDHVVGIFSMAQRPAVESIDGIGRGLDAVDISPDSRTLVCGGRDGLLHFRDLMSGVELHRRLGHTEGVHCLQYSADGRFLATGGNDGANVDGHHVAIWDVHSGERLKSLGPFRQPLRAVGFSPSGELLVASDGETVAIWTTNDWTRVASPIATELQGVRANCFDFTQDDEGILVANDRSGAIEYYLSHSGVGHQCDLSHAVVTCIGRHPRSDWHVIGRQDGTVMLCEWLPGHTSPEVIAHNVVSNVAILDVNFSPDGKTFATIDRFGRIGFFEAARGENLMSLTINMQGAQEDSLMELVSARVRFSPDGKTFVAAGGYHDRQAGNDQTGILKIWRILE